MEPRSRRKKTMIFWTGQERRGQNHMNSAPRGRKQPQLSLPRAGGRPCLSALPLPAGAACAPRGRAAAGCPIRSDAAGHGDASATPTRQRGSQTRAAAGPPRRPLPRRLARPAAVGHTTTRGLASRAPPAPVQGHGRPALRSAYAGGRRRDRRAGRSRGSGCSWTPARACLVGAVVHARRTGL